MISHRIGIYLDGAHYYYGYEDSLKLHKIRIPIKKFLKLIKKISHEILISNNRINKTDKLKFSRKKYFNGNVTNEYFPLIESINFDLKESKFDMKIREMEFYFDKKGDKKIRQKGVDVEITVEIMEDLRKSRFDILIFCGTDCDFIPLFEHLKKSKIILINLFFNRSELSNYADFKINYFDYKWKNEILKWA